MKWRVFGILFPVVLIGALVYLITRPKPVNDKPQEDKPVLYAGSDDPGTVDPQGISWGEQTRIANNVFETLVKFGGDAGSLVPGLANSWTTSTDGKTIEFTLRAGIKFHDGTDFNADAVVFAIERLQGKGAYKPKEIPYGSFYTDIDKAEAVNPTQVRITLKAPSPIFLSNMAMFPAGIPSPTAVKKDVEKFGQNPAGTGPYKLVEWVKDQKIVLARNETYWGKAPSVGKIIIQPVRDAATRTQKLLNGEVTILDNVSPTDVGMLQKDARFRVNFGTAMNIAYLGFNMNTPPYNDINFRKAVAMTIDKKKLIELAYFGTAEAARSIVPPSIWAHDADAPEPAIDREKAKELLAKVPNMPESVELMFPSYSRPYMPDPDKLAQSIQDDLKQIGIKVKLKSLHRDSLSNEIHRKDHGMILLGWSADIADPDNFLFALLHGDSIPNDGNNITFFNHTEFNDVTKKAQTELDVAKRKDLYIKAQRIYKEEVPSIPLVHMKQVVAYTNKLKYNQHAIETRLWNLDWEK